MESHNWKITQKAIDCTGMIAAKKKTGKIQGNYRPNTNKSVYPNDYFEIGDASNCAISSCKLYQNDCKTEWIEDAIMEIGTKNPWMLVVKQDQIEGYTRTVCIACNNPAEQATVQLTVKQTRVDCSANIKPKPIGEIPEAEGLAYTTKAFTYLSTSQFFVNTKPEYCSFKPCKLKKAGCEETFSSDYISIAPGSGNSYVITIK
jgi:hypothetical protein